jgi:AcrR family transcriptional regulator
MGRPRHDENAVATTTRIVDAAVEAFAAEGFDGATLADIGAKAGITRPSLLYHFPSKERVYAAALERVFHDIEALVHAATVINDGVDAIHADAVLDLVDGFAAFAASSPHTSRLLLRAIVADQHAATRDMVLSRAVPIIDAVEAFARSAGAAGPGLRHALMAVIVDVLARAAAGDGAAALWGVTTHRAAAARALFGVNVGADATATAATPHA